MLQSIALADPTTTAIDIHAEMFEHQRELFVDDGIDNPFLHGLVIASATDINDQGVIVGYLFPDGSEVDIYHRRGYVLDTHLSTNVDYLDDRAVTRNRRLILLVS